MKLFPFLLFLFAATFSFGQQYDTVHFERGKVDKDNSIFTLGREFTYSFTIHIDGKEHYLKSNENNDFELTTTVDEDNINEIHQIVVKPKWFQRTNKGQTEIYYSYEPNPTFSSSTGAVENSENIWIHPPRDRFFKALETCPFPYIKRNQPVGYKWSDKMSIGSYWADERWGQWEDRLLLNYEYEITGQEVIKTALGSIDCEVVTATASSEIGTSKLIAYFSDQWGFVKLDYTLFNGTSITLDMIDVSDREIIRTAKDFFESRF